MLVYHQMLTYIIYLLQVFDYSIDSETHEFCKLSDIIPSYTGTPHVGIPSDANVLCLYLLQVFDYSIDSETHEFCKWSDIIPSYTGTPHVGIPSDAYVHYIFIAGV